MSDTPPPADAGGPADPDDAVWGAPEPPSPGPAKPGYVLTIGDIGITGDDGVVTPNGTIPLRGTRWLAMDQSTTTEVIPTYAFVWAIILAVFCLLGLLLLLIRVPRTTGYVLVTVSADGFQHSTQIPVFDRYAVAEIRGLVAEAQGLSARA